jgi:lysophospholipase L1-like esterase
MLPAYDSGDHLHPSAAGYKAMADAIPLKVLR